MVDDVEPAFDDQQFARSVVRILIEDSWFEVAPTVELNPGGSSLPVHGLIHVVSARNPGFKERDDVNDRLHRELEQRLQGLGLDPMSAVGMSRDGSWIEPSWALASIDRSTACGFGREFGQLAVFEIDVLDQRAPKIRVLRCSDGVIVSDLPCRIDEIGGNSSR